MCYQVTEGPDSGKLALLDFGLVAEIPQQDRAAMVSATIHLVRAASLPASYAVRLGTVLYGATQCGTATSREPRCGISRGSERQIMLGHILRVP